MCLCVPNAFQNFFVRCILEKELSKTDLLNDVIETFSVDYKFAEWETILDDILRDDYTPAEVLQIM